jgi:hypothetical protein
MDLEALLFTGTLVAGRANPKTRLFQPGSAKYSRIIQKVFK